MQHELSSWAYELRHRLNIMDEYQFLVPKDKAQQTAYLMQIGHAWCWALVHYKAGLTDMPLSCAFASAINIDKTWRKSASASVTTPTFEDIVPGKEYSMPELNELAKQNNYWSMNDD